MSDGSGLDVLNTLFVRTFGASPMGDDPTDTLLSIKEACEDDDVELEKIQDYLHGLFTLLCRCNHEYAIPYSLFRPFFSEKKKNCSSILSTAV